MNYSPTLLNPENSRIFGKYSEKTLETLSDVFNTESAKLAVASGWLPSMTMRTCDHKIHPKCVPNSRRLEDDINITSTDIGTVL